VNRVHVLGSVALAAALVVALAPLAPWFSADVPGGTARAAGVEASGALWAAPPVGLVGALLALLVLRAAAPRPVGVALAVLGAAALLLTLPVVASPPVRLVADAGGVAREFPVAPALLPAAYVAPLAAAALVLAGLALAGPLRRLREADPA